MEDSGREIAIIGRLGVYPMVRLPLPARRILAYLTLHEQPISRAAASAQLWPDQPEEQGRANLRRALWQLPRGWVSSIGDDLMLLAGTDFARARQVAAKALEGGELESERNRPPIG